MGLKLCQLIAVATLLHLSTSSNVYSDNLKSVSTPQTSSDTGRIQGGQSIQAYLKELRTAQLPAINFFSPSKSIIFNRRLRLSPTSAAEEGNNCNGTQLSEKEKLAIWRREQQEQLFRNLTTGPITLFEGKYLYENGEHKENIDSFSKLTKNHFFPKKYLVELNRKLYKGGILPPSGKEFQVWLDSIQTKSVTIIDAGIESLTKDIQSKFNEWKFPLEVTYGNIPEHLEIPSFKTEQKYKVTHLTFELVTTPQSVVIVKAQQLNTSLLIIPSKNGAPLHLQMMDPLDSAQPSNLLRENRNITNFTIEELHANAKLAKNFWKDVGIPSGVHNVLLNEKYLYENFLEIIRENDKNLLHQVINPAKEEEPPVEGVCFTVRDVELDDGDKEDPCAFYLDPAGQVEAIHPIVFVKIYEKADKTQKKKMATLAKHNIDKVEARVDNELERNIMIKLIQLEDIKSHAASTEVALSIQNIDDPHGSADPAHFVKTLEDMEKQVSEEKCELKLSPYKIAFKLSNLATLKSSVRARKELSPGVETGSKITDKSIGYLFLGQTIINGIITWDTTALAIVGARTGFDIITGAAVKIGTNTKYFAEASKVGKSAKAIGDVAGPIGSGADIGLGVWSLTKAVNNFRNAENKYDRNDAIADIVQESVSIAVEATVTILSAVFPPFAPLFEAIGAIIDLLSQLAIAIFKAANEVARINSKIPLSSSEKKYVFNSRFMDWFGTRQKDYLEFLLEEQAANNMAVQHNLKFLQDNPSFLGVVFPSRTLYYDGGCRLTKRHCALKNAWGCTRWENTVTLGTGCDRNRLCGTSWKEICTDFRRNVGTWGYDEFKCPCSGSTTSFGEPRRHSTVDFRATKRLYWERAVPEDVSGAEFKCKPGSVTFQDYKVHQEAARTDFLCENAIAILQPRNKRNSTQIMLFNLEDGNDTVYLPTNDPTPNLFRVGNGGNKLFNGGSGKNEFLIDGDCSGNLRGTLTGGRSDVDAVTVLNSCAKGGILNFNGRTISTSDNKVFMQLTSIEAINGRDDEPDLATVDCLTRKVALGGGKDNQRRDVITIPTSTSCVYNVTALTGSYTTVQSEARRGTVSVLVDGRWKSAITNLDVHPDDNLKLSMIFASTQSSQVTITTVNRSSIPAISETVVRKSQNGDDMNIKLNFAHHPQPYPQQSIYFREVVEESPYSYLLLSPSTAPLFYHTLSPTTSTRTPSRSGNSGIENFFQIGGPNWSVTGGEKNDMFILNTTLVTLIDGKGGEDTIQIDSSLKQSVTINLAEKFKNIETVFGSAGYPLRVDCACDTKLVVSNGGSRTDRDSIYVPAGACSQRNLQIQANGTTYINIAADVPGNGNITIVATASGQSSNPFQFELVTTSQNVTELVVALELTHKNWTSLPATKSSNGQSLTFRLEAKNNEHTVFTMRDSSEKIENQPYITAPYIQIFESNSTQIPGQLVLDREALSPKVFYQLSNITANKTGPNVIQGFQGISNMFLVSGGASWEMTGGNSSDVFIISSSGQEERLTVNGGIGGDDTLILESKPKQRSSSSPLGENKTYVVNLDTEQLSYLNATRKGVIKNIEHILGRDNEVDIIYTNCNTKTVNGREGAGEGEEDLIFITESSCQRPGQITEIFAGKFTKVKNTAVNGTFTYHVADPITSELELRASKSNMHFVEFSINSWEYIQRIRFDERLETLGIHFGQGDADRVQLFKMHIRNNSEEYDNPVIDFHKPGSRVTSDIRVGKDGVVAATFMVHEDGHEGNMYGLPVDINRFLVNITKQDEKEEGEKVSRGIYGSTTSEANLFWFFELNSSLGMLDGGRSCLELNSNGSFDCTNYLHFGETFQRGEILEVGLDEEKGYIKSGGKMLVPRLKNIHELRGRWGGNQVDKVTISSCTIREVSEVEEVVVKLSTDCSMELLIGIGNETRVLFEDGVEFGIGPEKEEKKEWIHSTFHYRFDAPRSFDIEGSSELAWLGPTHNYYLPFTVDELDDLFFDLETEQLHYTINGSEYYHTMIVGSNYDEQFYAQPVLITQDAFKINVVRDGSILLALGAGSSFSSETLRSEVVPAFEEVATKLGVTIMMQTDTQLVYVGHGKKEGDRNVLQSVGYCESHLVGSGANDTIYEVAELKFNVVIYTGFEASNESTEEVTTKQTIDLSDIIVPLRMETGIKYVPKVERQNDDLVISMEGHEDKHPGKIWIVNGALERVSNRIQILLSSAMMEVALQPQLQLNGNAGFMEETGQSMNSTAMSKYIQPKWKIQPRPIRIPIGSVYSLSGEDFEDEHRIQLEEVDNGNVTNTNATFQMARNGTDLYFTNIISNNENVGEETQMELTTLIISDYFKEEREVYSNETLPVVGILPSKVTEVTVSLPGLQLVLNNSQIIFQQENSQLSRLNVRNTATSILTELRDWMLLLQEAESRILENI